MLMSALVQDRYCFIRIGCLQDFVTAPTQIVGNDHTHERLRLDKLDKGVLDEAASKTALEDVLLRLAFNSQELAFASMRSIIKG
jgi:hypothetical protein